MFLIKRNEIKKKKRRNKEGEEKKRWSSVTVWKEIKASQVFSTDALTCIALVLSASLFHRHPVCS